MLYRTDVPSIKVMNGLISKVGLIIAMGARGIMSGTILIQAINSTRSSQRGKIKY